MGTHSSLTPSADLPDEVVIVVTMKTVRTVMRYALLITAALWLLLEAVLVLEATFAVPHGLSALINYLARQRDGLGILGSTLRNSWPLIALIILSLVRQEAHRWFEGRKDRRSADVLMTAWFVFIGTLFIADYLSEITLVLPKSAVETSVWLISLLFLSWASRLSHALSRRLKVLIVRRRHITAILREILKVVAWSAVRKHLKGLPNDKLPRSTHNGRKAA